MLNTLHTPNTQTSIVYFKPNQFSNAQVVFPFEKCNSKTNVCLCTNCALNHKFARPLERGKITVWLLVVGVVVDFHFHHGSRFVV